MIARDIVLLPPSMIRPTERFCPRRAAGIATEILRCGFWTRPICIEHTVGALLDGHHRLAAAALLGLARVPVHVFDYREVTLTAWRPHIAPSRDEVLDRALTGDLLPAKATRHVFAARFFMPVPIAILLDAPEGHPCPCQLGRGETASTGAASPSEMRRRR